MLALAEYDASPQLKKVTNEQDFFFFVREKPLQKRVLDRVGKRLHLTNQQFATIAGVSARTYQRQKPTTKISVTASENTMRLAELLKQGIKTFDGDEQSFFAWLRTPVISLGNKKPLDLITSGIGMQRIMEELLRMEYSVI